MHDALTRHVARRTGRTGPAGPRLTADERRAEIVDAAVKAFASGGLAGTSTEEIARLAGVSQPYLFRLFGTKRDLFLAAVGHAFDRVEAEFDHAASKVDPDEAPINGMHPILWHIGVRYQEMLADRTLLRIQLHAYAACDDPEVRVVVRARFAHLVAHVAELSGEAAAGLRTFFAEGMLLNVAAAMDLNEAEVAWQRLCEGGPA